MKTHVGQKGKLNYLFAVLKDKKTVVSRVAFWKIPHDHNEDDDIHLRIGRYSKKKNTLPGDEEIPEVDKPKSSLTLDKSHCLSSREL